MITQETISITATRMTHSSNACNNNLSVFIPVIFELLDWVVAADRDDTSVISDYCYILVLEIIQKRSIEAE